MFICDISIWDHYGKQLLDKRLLSFGLDWREMIILLVIERESGLLQTRLIPFLQTDKANVTKVLQSMEAKGLIIRTQDPADHRSKRCHHTDSGRALLPELHRVMKSWTAECFEGISVDELDVYRQVGDKLSENMVKKVRSGQ